MIILQKESNYFVVKNEELRKQYIIKHCNIMSVVEVFEMVNKEKYGGYDDLKFVGYAPSDGDIFNRSIMDWVIKVVKIFENENRIW